MERFTVTATSNARLPRRPILDGDQPPLTSSAFPLKPQSRDPSFSTFLCLEDPKPPQILQNPIPKKLSEENEISIFDAQRYFNEGQDQKQSNTTTTTNNNNNNKNKNAGAVSVINVKANASSSPPEPTTLDRIAESFDAIHRYSSSSSYGRNYRARSFHATPTASSEASWNSQSGLLSNPPGSMAISMRNIQLENNSKKGFWFFRRKCPCSGKKSVQVEDKFSVSEPKKQRPKTGEPCPGKALEKKLGLRLGEIDRATVKSKSGSFSPDTHFASAEINSVGHRLVSSSTRSFNDSNGFSFPILNPPNPSKLALNIKSHQFEEDPPRESLEVFKPSEPPFNFSPRARPTAIEDDMVSDASSDLFEIESFSTQSTTYPMYKNRDSLDETSSFDSRTRFGANGLLNFRHSLDETTVTTTTTTTTTATPSRAPTEYCYEPSEASIEWSVTTAEGFERASVTNMSVSTSEMEEARGWKQSERQSMNGRRKSVNGLLMSCRCEKAVSVGPHPHPMRGLGSDHRVQGRGFQVEPSGRVQVSSGASSVYM